MRAIFLDTETGGLDAAVHSLTSLAAVAFEVDAQIGVRCVGKMARIGGWV